VCVLPEIVELLKCVSKQIHKVNSRKSSGPDGIHSKFLNEFKCENPSYQVCRVTYHLNWLIRLKKIRLKILGQCDIRFFRSLLGEIWETAVKLI